MCKPRFIKLSPEEDTQLRHLEQAHGIHPKVRLRASILRLSNQGFSVTQLVQHFARDNITIYNDFNRWEQSKLEGLIDGKAKGNPRKFTPEITAFIQLQFKQDRAFSCSQLIELIKTHFKVSIAREAMRVHLLELGYTWQRSRYVPEKPTDPEVVRQSQVAIESLKKGHWKSV
jgi:transposase